MHLQNAFRTYIIQWSVCATMRVSRRGFGDKDVFRKLQAAKLEVLQLDGKTWPTPLIATVTQQHLGVSEQTTEKKDTFSTLFNFS